MRTSRPGLLVLSANARSATRAFASACGQRMPRPRAPVPPSSPTRMPPTPCPPIVASRLSKPLPDPSKNRGSVRSSLALIATAGLVAVALSGCAAAPTPEADAGQSSDAVVVKGDFGKNPRVDFPFPLAPEETQCTEIIAGEGDVLEEGQQALVGLAVYNGATGEELQ